MHALERSAPNVTGHLQLDGACETFADSWKYGLKQLNESLNAIGEGMTATARSGRQADEAVRIAMAGQAA
ncbi:hypothetical protein AB0K43_11455 [Kitasatospora sp. NPDC049258]|uniref:hypothetical protein n=1 Tax=Kitasatospora sp. NPDC049258 TaxID=3155394 RepID=UPI003447CCF3